MIETSFYSTACISATSNGYPHSLARISLSDIIVQTSIYNNIMLLIIIIASSTLVNTGGLPTSPFFTSLMAASKAPGGYSPYVGLPLFIDLHLDDKLSLPIMNQILRYFSDEYNHKLVNIQLQQ